MFIFGYFVVTLADDRRPIFPSRCVVCSKAADTFVKVFSTPESGHPIRLLTWTTIAAPAHKECAKVLLYAHYLRFFVLGVVSPLIVPLMYVILGIGNIWTLLSISCMYILLMVLVYLWVRLRLKQKDPVPFRFESYWNKTSYTFIDKGYAEEFARLNDSVIEPG